MTDRFPHPVQRANERLARSADRLLLMLAVVTVALMLGGVL